MTKSKSMRMAAQAIEQGRLDRAVEILLQLLQRYPEELQARWLLLQARDRQGELAAAFEQARLILAHQGITHDAINQVAAYLLSRLHPLAPALEAYGRYREQHPTSSTATFNHAYYLAKDGQFAAAIDTYRQALEQGCERPEEAHLNLANLYMDHFLDPERARQELEAAQAASPEDIRVEFNLGNLAERLGQVSAAERHFSRCLELDAGKTAALARLADLHHFESKEDPLLTRLADAGDRSADSDLHFALGRAWEQLGEYEAAWRSFERGNELDRMRMPPYDPGRQEAWVERIRSACTPDWLAQFAGSSHAPVFICGMFRTGSTLLEQMLAAHPAFAAGGESEFFPRLVARHLRVYPQGLGAVTPEQTRAWAQAHRDATGEILGTAARAIDKRPDNFLYLGLIKAVLPGARFIVTRRDWRDVATSIFGTRLGLAQNYATRLQDIRHYIGLQDSLVEHWAGLLGPDLAIVRYEDLVDRPRETLAAVLEGLGEAWDERCMEFHGASGLVQTASVLQVRQPLHGGAKGRWEHYRFAFEEAFGDLPQA